jgi:glycosyltransferase involved in cell wall biosynthesis
VVTNSRSLIDIVRNCKCGRVYRDTDPGDLAKVVQELANPELREKLGKAGFEAVLQKHNWAVDERILTSAISKLVVGS